MTALLLDASVLIPLVVAEHEHHERAAAWSLTVERVALCPITEGALVRFLVRTGESPQIATALLQALRATPKFEFWPDSVSYADLALDGVHGYRQVTDTYLAGLARANRGRLATFDAALAATHPDDALLVQ